MSITKTIAIARRTTTILTAMPLKRNPTTSTTAATPNKSHYINKNFSRKLCMESHSSSRSSCKSYKSKTLRVTTFTAAAATTALLGCLGHNTIVSAFSMNMSAATLSTTTTSNKHPLANLSDNFDHSWVSQLSSETEENRIKSKNLIPQDDGVSNNVRRPVYNGHYVPVKPDPLLNPRLVIHSPDMAAELNLSADDVKSDEFVKYFSGDVYGAFNTKKESNDDDGDEKKNDVIDIKTWATPYALSIMGTRYTSNCPFGTGDGYGDGRAISIGEVAVANTSHPHASPRYELQLKGAGPTPFCRGADGRAVLRSSIREFLASEAMHYLGIQTTRALSLIVSEKGNTSQRPWYSDRNKKSVPSIDDPRLAKYSLEQRKQIISQLNAQSKNDPDIMIEEPNAITCRVAPSFVRVGHLDLFARRATKNVLDDDTKPDKTTNEFKELEDLVWHACFREFPSTCYEPFREKDDILSASKNLLEHSMEGIATMVAGWVKVGFAQGNFNADNCLVAGRTMDYGPFGFMDEYHPLFAKWTGSGEHFGFLNQINAGFANFAMLVSSVMPIIEAHSESMQEANAFKEEILEKGQQMFENKLMGTFRAKMGFHPEDESVDEIWSTLEPLLRESRTDWTVFWRQLYIVAKTYPVDKNTKAESTSDYEKMFETLCADDDTKPGSSPFYAKLDDETTSKFIKWIQSWREALIESYKEDGPSTILGNEGNDSMTPEERMRISNPKYVLREWMLVEAYTQAAPTTIQPPMMPFIPNVSEVDESMIHELFQLIQNPYDEGSDDFDSKYFRRAPDEALKAGGTAFMS